MPPYFDRPQRVTIEFSNDSERGYRFIAVLQRAGVHLEEVRLDRDDREMRSFYRGTIPYYRYRDTLRVTFVADLFQLWSENPEFRDQDYRAHEPEPTQLPNPELRLPSITIGRVTSGPAEPAGLPALPSGPKRLKP